MVHADDAAPAVPLSQVWAAALGGGLAAAVRSENTESVSLTREHLSVSLTREHLSVSLTLSLPFLDPFTAFP